MKKILGVCYSPFTDPWTPQLWKSLAAVGLNWVRLSVELFRLCPTPDQATWRLAELDACIAAIRAAGLALYLNPCGCPAWASEGQPAYEDALVGDCWWNVPDARTPDGRPDQFPHGLHDFDQDPNRKDHVVDPTNGRVITGPELAAIDLQRPPRPWRTKPPHRDPKFYRDVFVLLELRYAPTAIGVENEPGAYTSPVMRNCDIAFGGPEDTITTRFFPEIVEPALGAVLDVDPNAWTIGVDADSDEILRRCCAADAARTIGRLYKIRGVHPYGDINPGADYASTARFQAANQELGDEVPMWCTEIGGEAETVLGWFRGHASSYPAVFMMPWTIFLGPLASQFVAEFAKINGPAVQPSRRRAVKP